MKKILLLSSLVISGCVLNSSIVSTDNLTSLSDKELCMALGQNRDNGRITLKILGELEARGDTVDREKCHVLEEMAVQEKAPQSPDKANDSFKKDPAVFHGRDPQLPSGVNDRFMTEKCHAIFNGREPQFPDEASNPVMREKCRAVIYGRGSHPDKVNDFFKK